MTDSNKGITSEKSASSLLAEPPQKTVEKEDSIIRSINQKLANINQIGFEYYEEEDLDKIHLVMQKCLTDARSYYVKYIVNFEDKDKRKEKRDNIVTLLDKKYKEKDIVPDNDTEKLIVWFLELGYTLLSAFDEVFLAQKKEEDNITRTIKEQTPEELLNHFVRNDPNIKMIQLCKNVRTMEDLLNRICTNNIDKSIVKGERHLESMRNGFKWLFCQGSPTFDMNAEAATQIYHSVDIRDKNRFLDFLKYQIMALNRYFVDGPRASSEVDRLAEVIEKTFLDNFAFKNKRDRIKLFKETVSVLIDQFFDVYTLLTEYCDLLFKEEEVRRKLRERGVHINDDTKKNRNKWMPSAEIVILSAVILRVLTDRFVSFVKINDLNFGNSTFIRSWFNYSELSDGNYAGSSFQHVRIENAIVRRCDLSTCDFSDADVSGSDFTGSNFNYSNLTGTNFKDSILNKCQFQSAIFRDIYLDSYKSALSKIFKKENIKGNVELRHALNVYNNVWDLTPPTFEDPKSELLTRYNRIDCPILRLPNDTPRGTILTLFKLPDGIDDMKKDIYLFTKDYLRSLTKKIIPSAVLNAAERMVSDSRYESDEEKRTREDQDGRVRFLRAVLINASAKGCQMNGTDLSHVCIENATFEDSDLSNAVLFYTPAGKASFIKTNLNGTECFESCFAMANFSKCTATGARFINCNLCNTNWNSAILINAMFLDASHEIRDLIFNDEKSLSLCLEAYFANESQTERISSLIRDKSPADVLVKAHSDETIGHYWQKECAINEAKMETALMDNTSFYNICSDKSSFKDSSLKSVIFANCSMHLTDFINADLRYAFITLSSFGNSNFHHANLTMAEIRYVEFCSADLSDALLNSAKLNRVLFSGANLEKLNLTKAIFVNCVFVDCNMEGMILQNAVFENCIFENLDFTKVVAKRSARFVNCIGQFCRDEDTLQNIRNRDGIFFLDIKD